MALCGDYIYKGQFINFSLPICPFVYSFFFLCLILNWLSRFILFYRFAYNFYFCFLLAVLIFLIRIFTLLIIARFFLYKTTGLQDFSLYIVYV